MMALHKIQETIYHREKQRTDLYYLESKGILIVLEGKPLIPQNVLYKIDEWVLHSNNLVITRVKIS